MNTAFSPGSLVRVRNRDWVVESDSTATLLHLRPLAGGSAESAYIVPALEPVPPRSAEFSMPAATSLGNLEEIRLLQDAMRMKLRAGAGPFRSFGNIAVEPRVYQLVPLLMALRMPTVRLLIADDVGVGKTIEAALIVRELIDRGELTRFTVLCPPNLVDQWQRELENHFNLRATAVTSATAKHLDREVPAGSSLFEHFRYTIVSLDYIKSERHRATFLNHAPSCIVVDEAHACTQLGNGHQQRFNLLRELAADTKRHLIMLTATPHSGNEEGFYNMLSLLSPRFLGMQDATQRQRANLREQLARFLIQRRRANVENWGEETRIFPRRRTAEQTYRLTGEWGSLFDDVQAYCKLVAEARAAGGNQLAWYSTLSLLRCVSSSPAAAVAALTSRMQNALPAVDIEDAGDDVLDNEDTTEPTDSETILQGGEDGEQLQEFIARAKALTGPSKDPKLHALIDVLKKDLLKSDFHPIVFCRYVHTAEYVAEELKKAFPAYNIVAVTGSIGHELREKSIEDLCTAEKRILVATNCLSEGINLQEGFDAVVHYDMAWNPTRHEQREGRVDRYGQKAAEVRCLMLYGEDNPIDGFILNVILKKAEAIRIALGVKVPVPDDKEAISKALMQAALLKREEMPMHMDRMLLNFDEVLWKETQEKAENTLFAQRSLRPEEVLPEWERQSSQIGTHEDVQRFVEDACRFLQAPLTPVGHSFTLNTHNLPAPLQEDLEAEGAAGLTRLAFQAADKGTFISRSHPLVSEIADYLTEQALEDESPLIHRAAVTPVESEHVTQRTVLYFTRMRHRLTFNFANTARSIMAEEAVVLIKRPQQPLCVLPHEEMAWVRALVPTGNIMPQQAQQQIQRAADDYRAATAEVEKLARQRAQQLLEDHQRVRSAAHADAGRVQVESCLPVDVIAISVLLPTL